MILDASAMILDAIPTVADLGGGARGALAGGEMVSAQYLRGARRGGGNLLAGRPKILGEGEMKTYIRH